MNDNLIENIIEEIARRDTTDGTVKCFSGKEVAEIIRSVATKPFKHKTEMEKLIGRLDYYDIPWTDESGDKIERTMFKHNGYTWSVICGYGTYGGEDGLLELMSGAVDHGEPIGHLTANQVIRYMFTRRD